MPPVTFSVEAFKLSTSAIIIFFVKSVDEQGRHGAGLAGWPPSARGRNQSRSLLFHCPTVWCALMVRSNREQSARSKIANLLTKWDTAK